MEVTNALLVAMMFVVLLTIGIGNIVMSLAAVIDRRTTIKAAVLHTSWVILLLLVYFNLFWHVLDLLAVQDWKFLDFLYIVSGAILIVFATHVLLPDASSSDANDLRLHYMGVSHQFFLFMSLLQAWTLGVDFLLGTGLTVASAFNLVALVLFVVLMLSRAPGLHRTGAVTTWILFLAAMAARGAGIIH
jgi:hypothetical protein